MLLDREYCMEHNIVSGRRDVLSEVWAKFTLFRVFLFMRVLESKCV